MRYINIFLLLITIDNLDNEIQFGIHKRINNEKQIW